MEYVTVFSNFNPGLIAIAKSVLDAENIEYIVPNETLANIYGAGAIEIRVPKDRAQEARDLLNQLSELEE